MKNSTSVTVTKRRVRLSVTSIRRTSVKDDPVEPNIGLTDRECAGDFDPTITSPARSAAPSEREDIGAAIKQAEGIMVTNDYYSFRQPS